MVEGRRRRGPLPLPRYENPRTRYLIQKLSKIEHKYRPSVFFACDKTFVQLITSSKKNVVIGSGTGWLGITIANAMPGKFTN